MIRLLETYIFLEVKIELKFYLKQYIINKFEKQTFTLNLRIKSS